MADGGKAREVKVVLLGDTGVGKSSLVLRFVTNNFRPYSESTIGASFMSKMIVVNDTPIKYQIWDTAGQEKVCLCVLYVFSLCAYVCANELLVCLLSPTTVSQSGADVLPRCGRGDRRLRYHAQGTPTEAVVGVLFVGVAIC